MIEEESEDPSSYAIKAVHPDCNALQDNYLACYEKQSLSFRQGT